MVRNFMRWMLVLPILWGSSTWAEGPEIPSVTDLRQEAALVQRQKTPLLLMFYADHCGYCERMEREFLKPMLISGAYEDKVVIRRVRLDPYTRLRDFQGVEITGAGLAERYNVFVTPTLLLLNPQGAMLTEKIVGLGTPDFFGGYLDASIEDSIIRLRGTSAMASKQRECDPVC